MLKQYTGWLQESYGEGDLLRLDTSNHALSEEITDDIEEYGNFLSVRYFVTDQPVDIESAVVNWQHELLGTGEAEYDVFYSDITGYLWTDEKICVGGHDLLAELYSFCGKYLIMEIEYSGSPDK